MAETTDLTKTESQKIQTISVDNSSFSSYLDTAKFNQMYRVANLFAASDLVPEHYRNKPANCFLALQMATRLEIEPMMFIQNSYIVRGKPGLQAVVMIALVNSRGPFTGPIQWSFKGEGNTRSCTAYATHKVTRQVCEATVTWEMVKKEGWHEKPGSKWLSMPDLMLQYRSAAFLARLYCPEVILGLPTVEELEDIEAGTGHKPVEQTGRIEERLAKKPIESKIVQPAPEPPTAPIETNLDAVDAVDVPTDPVDKPPTQIPENERYYCQECGETFAKPMGLAKDMCSKLHKNIIDRWAKP